MSLLDQYPTLFYDIKQVEQKTPKPLPPMSVVMAAVISKYGVSNNPALAQDLADAAEEMFKLRAAATTGTVT